MHSGWLAACVPAQTHTAAYRSLFHSHAPLLPGTPQAVNASVLKPLSYPHSLFQTLPDIAQKPARVSKSPLLALPGPLWWEEGKRTLVESRTLDASWSEENQRKLGTEERVKSWVGGVHLHSH